MQWIERFHLFLFDFDGVLVNTEPLHYAAYAKLCDQRELKWTWSFEEYCAYAHGESQGIKHALYREFPELLKQEPHWEALATEKKKIYNALLETQSLKLMPDVAELLHVLQEQKKMRCVVTNSSRESVEKIKASLPILDTIPHWLTREDYTHPKPSSEGYRKAIALCGSPKEGIIGFEDTLKGFKALSETSARAVLLCPAYCKHVAECIAMGGHHFESFKTIHFEN